MLNARASGGDPRDRQPSGAHVARPTPAEMAQAGRFVTARLTAQKPCRPFSFTYDGRPSAEVLPQWRLDRQTDRVDSARTRHTLTYTDSATGLDVRCEAVAYEDYPAVEWVVYFENNGDHDTPVIEHVQAMDIPVTGGGPFVIHHAEGSDARFSDFRPLSDTLASASWFVLHSHGWPTSLGAPSGSPSVEALPFFNLDVGGEGLITAIGWTGPWIAEFLRDGDRGVMVRAGMDRTHLRLRPGERIRTPRILILLWQEDRIRGHNLWRRLLLDHYSPRPGGKPFEGLLCDANWGSWMPADKHIAQINRWGERGLPMECYWIDAGWSGDMSKGWEAHQSDRTPNSELFPNGIRPVADAAHRRGMKLSLWLVPESIQPGLEIAAEHPEWVLEPFQDQAFGDMVFYGLDHGDPQVNQFMIDYYSGVINDYGIDVFRHDGLSLWPADADAERQGINQIRYNDGFYAFWDGLLERHPDLLIDNCGCGGRKLDLETIRRSVILWRSDCQASGDFDPISSQAFTYGLSLWLPLHGGAVPMVRFSSYAFRSAYAPALMLSWAVADPAERWEHVDEALLRKLLNEYLSVRPYFFGDFYPLTPYNLEQDQWMAWQFDRPDLAEGIVQAFRRANSPDEAARYELHGLDPTATYVVTDLDTGASITMLGSELTEHGLPIDIPNRPGAAAIVYRKARRRTEQ